MCYMSTSLAHHRGRTGCVHCARLICYTTIVVGYCLEAAALQEHGALGAARLSVDDWLGLDGSLERCRLRRKVGRE